MTISVTGKIVDVLAPKSGVSKSGNEWVTQEFVLEEENGDKVLFSVFGANKLAEYNLKVGSIAAVTLKLETTKWNDKYFIKLSCTSCMSNTGGQAVAAASPQPTPVSTPNIEAARETINRAPVSADSLPF